jgi:hypothetical protein
MAAECEIGLDSFLDRRQPEVFQSSDLCLREWLERESRSSGSISSR